MNYLLDAFIFVQSNKFTKITLSPDPSNVEISSSLIKKKKIEKFRLRMNGHTL